MNINFQFLIFGFEYVSKKKCTGTGKRKCPPMVTIIMRTQMRWIKHVVRMDNVFVFEF